MIRSPWKRLWTCAGLALAFAASAQSPAPTEAPAPPTARPLGDGLWFIPGGFLPNRQPDGNSVLIQGEEGLLVVDTGRHAWHRQTILDVASTQKAPIVGIVNTHWHLDHISGNPALKSQFPAATVYASDALDGALQGFLKASAVSSREYLKTANLPPETAEDIRIDLATLENGAALRPDVTVRADSLVPLGGRTVQLHLATNGPTAGDVWLWDDTSRTVIVGDLVTLPVPFFDTACVAGWQAALMQVANVPFQRVIPGHGQPMDRNQFGIYQKAFESFAACAASEQASAGCASSWVDDVASLLEANGQSAQRARGMANYYVEQVIRPRQSSVARCDVPHTSK